MCVEGKERGGGGRVRNHLVGFMFDYVSLMFATFFPEEEGRSGQLVSLGFPPALPISSARILTLDSGILGRIGC